MTELTPNHALMSDGAIFKTNIGNYFCVGSRSFTKDILNYDQNNFLYPELDVLFFFL